MRDGWWRRTELIGFLLLCCLGTAIAAWEMRNWGDTLSPVDAFSEANAVREVHNFVQHGLLANHGLGNVEAPGIYPGQGFMRGTPQWTESVSPSGVYTHYPPGPEYLLYVARKLLGPASLVHLRLLPLAITWMAAVWFGVSIRRRFGSTVGWLVMTACVAVPTFSDADSYLHYDGYAFALLLIEIGIAIGHNKRVAPFLLLGFLQGWLSFDYAFLVATAPIAIELAMPRLETGYTGRLRLGCIRGAAAGFGFLLAHMLHLAEVWAFFGSFQAALQDLAHTAGHRFEARGGGGLLQRFATIGPVLHYYLFGRVPVYPIHWELGTDLNDPDRAFRFAGVTLGVWWAALTTALLPVQTLLRRRALSPNDSRSITSDWIVVSVCGLVPSILWYVVMLDHAMEHPHFLYRHLFFAFFLGTLFCATTIAQLLRSHSPRLLALISSTLRKNAPYAT